MYLNSNFDYTQRHIAFSGTRNSEQGCREQMAALVKKHGIENVLETIQNLDRTSFTEWERFCLSNLANGKSYKQIVKTENSPVRTVRKVRDLVNRSLDPLAWVLEPPQ